MNRTSTSSRSTRHGRAILRLICVVLLGSSLLMGASGALARSLLPERGSPSIEQEVSVRQCIDLLFNGGFEQGVADPDPWVLGGFAHVSEERSHGGSLGVWMGGYKNADDTLYQSVDIPSGVAVATLSYWWNMHSLDDTETPYDFLHASVRTSTGEPLAALETLDNTRERNSWSQSTFDVSSYSGTSVQIHFHGEGNPQFVTSFFVDDVELQVCGAPSTPTPTATSIPTPTATPTVARLEWRYLPLVRRDALQ